MTTRKSSDMVNVLEHDRPLYGYLPQGDGQYHRSKLGVMTRREYAGEDVNRLYFKPSTASTTIVDNGRDPKTRYSIGHVSDQFNIIDHAEVLSPLLALGYVITKIYYARGGLHMMATLEPKNPLVIDDLMLWDHEQWVTAGHEGDDTLRESLFVSAGMKPGRGIHVSRGWFRLICTNGLVAQILSLGSAVFSHRSWSSRELSDTIGKKWPQLTAGDENRGPILGTVKGVKKFGEVLSSLNSVRMSEDLFDDDDEDGVDPSRAAIRAQAVMKTSADLPMFIRDELATFAPTPAWLLVGLIQQLGLFAEHSKTKNFHALDLVNAYTSAVNLGVAEAEGRSAFRQLSKMENSVQSAMRLIGGFSM